MEPSNALNQLASEFIDAVYSDGGLNALVELASQKIGNPIYVIDSSDRILAACRQIRDSDTYMRPMIKNGYISELESSKMQSSRIRKKIYDMQTSFFAKRPERSGGGIFLLGPIRIQNKVVAYSCCMQLNRIFEDSDADILNIANKSFSIELQKSRIYQDNIGTRKGYQLLDAINDIHGQIENPTFGDWSAKKHKYILLIPFVKEHETIARRSNILLHIFKDAFRDGIVALNDYGIVVFLSLNTELNAHSERYQKISELLSLYEIHAGCSQSIQRFSEIRVAYKEAFHACEIGKALHLENSIIHFEDIILYRFFQLAEERASLERLCYPGLEKLAQYDQKKNTEYFLTLQQYIDSAMDISITAQTLNIHKNTLYYRLNKIKEIIGADLNDMRIIERILLTYKLQNWLNQSTGDLDN